MEERHFDEESENPPKSLRRVAGLLFGWFGVVGTALTVFGNISSLIDFSGYVAVIAFNWKLIVHFATTRLLELFGMPFPDLIVPYVSSTLFLSSVAIGSRLTRGDVAPDMTARNEARDFVQAWCEICVAVAYVSFANILFREFVANTILLEIFYGDGIGYEEIKILALTIVYFFLFLRIFMSIPHLSQKIFGHPVYEEGQLFSIIGVWFAAIAISGVPIEALGLVYFSTIITCLASFARIEDMAKRCRQILSIAMSFFVVALITLIPIPDFWTIFGFLREP